MRIRFGHICDGRVKLSDSRETEWQPKKEILTPSNCSSSCSRHCTSRALSDSKQNNPRTQQVLYLMQWEHTQQSRVRWLIAAALAHAEGAYTASGLMGSKQAV